MQVLKIPFSGVSVEAKEIVYPGGWDQNAHITLSQGGELIVPWTGTCKEHTYKDTNSVGSDYFLYDTGNNGAHVDTQNTGAYLTFDWDNDEYDLTYYSQNGIAPPKICKVESEPEAEGTLYQYVSTAGLTPDPTRALLTLVLPLATIVMLQVAVCSLGILTLLVYTKRMLLAMLLIGHVHSLLYLMQLSVI